MPRSAAAARLTNTTTDTAPAKPVATGPASALLAEPASLTQVSTNAAVRCPECGGSRLTRIGLVLTDGSPVDFTSCHNCEHKSWVHEGTDLPIDSVLDKARKLR
jgi:uncharacterized protein (DUF983 family)